MGEEEVKEEEGEGVEGRGKYPIVVKPLEQRPVGAEVVHRRRLRLLVLMMNHRRALRIVPRVLVVVERVEEEEEEGVEVLVGEEEEEGQAQARAVDMSPMAKVTVMVLLQPRPQPSHRLLRPFHPRLTPSRQTPYPSHRIEHRWIMKISRP
jgi:hypothetical protein